MSQSKTPQRIGVFEACSILCMAAAMVSLAAILLFAAARHRGFF